MKSTKSYALHLCMLIGVAQKTAISGTGGCKIPWQRAKESLSDVEFEKIFVFWFCFDYITFLMNLHHFPYFDPTKKSAKKNIIRFSGIPYWLRSIKNICACAQRIFGHNWSIGLMKSKIVEVKSFYNYLTHHLPAIREFSICWATLMLSCTFHES